MSQNQESETDLIWKTRIDLANAGWTTQIVMNYDAIVYGRPTIIVSIIVERDNWHGRKTGNIRSIRTVSFQNPEEATPELVYAEVLKKMTEIKEIFDEAWKKYKYAYELDEGLYYIDKRRKSKLNLVERFYEKFINKSVSENQDYKNIEWFKNYFSAFKEMPLGSQINSFLSPEENIRKTYSYHTTIRSSNKIEGFDTNNLIRQEQLNNIAMQDIGVCKNWINRSKNIPVEENQPEF